MIARAAATGIAAGIAALLLASSGGTDTGKEGGTFRVAVVSGFFDTIDPALVDSPFEFFPLAPACGNLMDNPAKPLPEGGRLRPELAAADPVVSRDGTTYTFTIRKDARFSNGVPVTARSFQRAIERVLDPKMNSGNAPDLAASIVGGEEVLAGTATTVSGVVARGRTLIVKLTKRDPTFIDWMEILCAVPAELPAEPEGAKPPLASAAPYYVAEYVPGQRLLLARNRFYKGERPHHVDRIEVDLGAVETTVVDEIASGKVDYGLLTVRVWAERSAELARGYGVNRGRFFVRPGDFLRMFVLNTSRPLFRNNVKLRQAVNFAVDRRALTRELGHLGGTPTDQFLKPSLPGYRNERIYPLEGPDLRKARALAKGRTRGGKAVLYTRETPEDTAMAQILRANLKAIGLELEIVQFPSGPLIFEKLATERHLFDIGRIAWGSNQTLLNHIFHGRTIGQPDSGNYSYFNSTKYNRLLDRAFRLSGDERHRAYGELDIRLSRDAAPAVPVAVQNAFAFVSARTGCVVMNPFFDLSAVCLK